MVFKKNYLEVFDEMFNDEKCVIEEGRKIAEFLASYPLKYELLEFKGIDTTNPVLLHNFNSNREAVVFNASENKERKFNVTETGFEIYSSDEDTLLFFLEKCLVERKETGEKGVALIEYSVLSDAVSFRYESYFEDGTLARKIYSLSGTDGLFPEYYEDCFFDEGIYYNYKKSFEDGTVSITKRNFATDLDDAYVVYCFDRGEMILNEEDWDAYYPLPEGFNEKSIPDIDIWNFNEELCFG